jgi:hypothetical protein
VLGQSCLYHIDGFSKIGLAIRHHHENYDGTGYPDGLRGKQIPLGSRLIRLADAFDNFAFAEGYPSRERVNEASALLVRGSGTLFDPELVRRFISLDVMQEFEFDDSGETVLVPPYDLREGMVVAEDVHTKNGMFLLPRGAKLSRGMINRIMKINNADPVPAGIQVFKASKPKKEKARHETVQDIISG